jgi:hypothetical protein
MARRFVLARQAATFRVTVNGLDLPEQADPIGNRVEFVFPAAYVEEERPEHSTVRLNRSFFSGAILMSRLVRLSRGSMYNCEGRQRLIDGG